MRQRNFFLAPTLLFPSVPHGGDLDNCIIIGRERTEKEGGGDILY